MVKTKERKLDTTPKSKVSKSVWSECKQCQCRLSPFDMSKHVESCHGSSAEGSPRLAANPSPNSSGIDRRNKYGFVRNGILHGFARENPNEDSSKEDKLPFSVEMKMLLLSPHVMSLLRIPVGSWVIVWVNKNKFVFQTAWPSKEFALTDIGLSEQTLLLLNCKTGDVVHIQRLAPADRRLASELVLEAREWAPYYSRDGFAGMFRYYFENVPMVVGASMVTTYLGRICKLKILDILPGECKTSDTTDLGTCSSNSFCSESDVCDGFSELSMTSTPKRKSHVGLCNCEGNKPTISGSPSYVDMVTRLRFSGHEDLTTTSMAGASSNVRKVSFNDIGGLSKQIEEVNRLLISSGGRAPPRGVVLFGAPGTGKTMIARAIANIMEENFIWFDGPALISKYYGETEEKLRNVFNQAKTRAPSVIFFDDIDFLCPKRKGSSTHQEQRIVNAFLSLIDDLPTDPDNRVVVLAATNKLDALDPAMRRAGRFDRKIETTIPTSSDRLQIMMCIMKRMKHSLTTEEIEGIASNAHGYVGGDLNGMLRRAGLNAVRRIRSSSDSWPRTSRESVERCITYSDVVRAAKETTPSSLREVQIEIPNVRWDDVGGQEDLKQKLKEVVEWPLKHPEVFTRMGISPPKGILMYGPPGCSKTLIAKALATESGLNFIAIKGSELFSKWVGESESAVREVFRKARASAPSIVFFDEIDAVAAERGSLSGSSNVGDRVLSQLLTEMDGLEALGGVVIIASTNRPDMIDKALLRPGRLDRIIYVSLPDAKTRCGIFGIQFRTMSVAPDVQMARLVESTEGYSGAEIIAVCREAALQAMHESLAAEQVFERHFLQALKTVRPRTSRELLDFYGSYGSAKGRI